MSAALIEFDRVSKSYPSGFWRRRVEVLHDLSFSVGRNEIVGFLGPNGAGKTTTIKIVNRLAFPDRGRVAVLGVERSAASERGKIGFMPEQPYFYEYLTGEEFLALCGSLNGLDRRTVRERTRELLGRVGLPEAGRISIRKYSKGMMQRLGLAQALLHDPELVILDEPMSGLDPMGRVEVRDIIRGLKEAGKTVFFSSHIIPDVETLCDRVVMIHEGRKVAEGTLDELLGHEGTSYVDIVFSPTPTPERIARAGLPDGRWRVQGPELLVRARDDDEANLWAGRLREAGALLRSYQPVKRRLEDLYVERVAGARARGEGL